MFPTISLLAVASEGKPNVEGHRRESGFFHRKTARFCRKPIPEAVKQTPESIARTQGAPVVTTSTSKCCLFVNEQNRA